MEIFSTRLAVSDGQHNHAQHGVWAVCQPDCPPDCESVTLLPAITRLHSTAHKPADKQIPDNGNTRHDSFCHPCEASSISADRQAIGPLADIPEWIYGRNGAKKLNYIYRKDITRFGYVARNR